MKRSDQEIAFDSWLIVLGETKLIGRISQSPKPSVTTLCPCYELVDAKQMMSDGVGSNRLINVVEVAPIAGCVDDVAVHIDRQSDRSPVIDLDQLSDSDRSVLKKKILSTRAALVEARAARSGLTVVGKMPTQ